MAAEWLAEAAHVFDGLSKQSREKKRATIIALVEARLAGRPEYTVWELPDTCVDTTYQYWKSQPDFAYALGEAMRLALAWRDKEAMRALKKAAERLAMAAPVAVARVIERLGSQNEAIILRAAFGILDRAGVDTAVKGAPSTMNIVLNWGESGEDGSGDDADHDAETA